MKTIRLFLAVIVLAILCFTVVYSSNYPYDYLCPPEGIDDFTQIYEYKRTDCTNPNGHLIYCNSYYDELLYGELESHYTYGGLTYTGNNYHLGSYHYFTYSGVCSASGCNSSFLQTLSYPCPGNGNCIPPNLIIHEIM